MDDVDHPPVVVSPGIPHRDRSVTAEDLIQSRPHALGLLGIQLHVAEGDDCSVAGHTSMLRVSGNADPPRRAPIAKPLAHRNDVPPGTERWWTRRAPPSDSCRSWDCRTVTCARRPKVNAALTLATSPNRVSLFEEQSPQCSTAPVVPFRKESPCGADSCFYRRS